MLSVQDLLPFRPVGGLEDMRDFERSVRGYDAWYEAAEGEPFSPRPSVRARVAGDGRQACRVCRREVRDGAHVGAPGDGHAVVLGWEVAGWTTRGLAVWAEFPNVDVHSDAAVEARRNRF